MPAQDQVREERPDDGVEDLLSGIDCCLADAEAGRAAAEKQQREAAAALYRAICAAHGDCDVSGDRLCPHVTEIRVWHAQYAHLFYWCCGQPVFGEIAVIQADSP